MVFFLKYGNGHCVADLEALILLTVRQAITLVQVSILALILADRHKLQRKQVLLIFWPRKSVVSFMILAVWQ